MDNIEIKDQNILENQHDVGEDIPDSFCCCVCLDLLYKPIVLSCGHMCCFWCVYRSMSVLHESQCPICRHQYYHFPTVCQALHFLLLKMYPVAYNRRIIQTLEEEKQSGFYSPQFDPNTCESQAKFGHSCIPSSSSIIKPVSNSCNAGTSSECMEQPGSTVHEGDDGTICSEPSSDREPEISGTVIEGKSLPQDELVLQQKISVADVKCTMCKQLLFHPVVLNCGHVYCETCVHKLADEMLRCQVCQSPHPKGFSKVCLEFDHFLEEQFPEEYARRREEVELNQINVKPETPSSCSLDNGNQEKNVEWWSDPDTKVHVGVGCDFCGMYPIIGDRYRCVDCKEKMGFDLCADCYDTRSKLPGRFNQQHTSDHNFKLIEPNIIRNIMLRLVTGQLGDSSIDSESLGNLEFTVDDSGFFGSIDGESLGTLEFTAEASGFEDGEDNNPNDPETTS